MPDVALPEKRLVGSSTLPLTTRPAWAPRLLTCKYRSTGALMQQSVSGRSYPCVAVVYRKMSHADHTKTTLVVDASRHSRTVCPRSGVLLRWQSAPRLGFGTKRPTPVEVK